MTVRRETADPAKVDWSVMDKDAARYWNEESKRGLPAVADDWCTLEASLAAIAPAVDRALAGTGRILDLGCGLGRLAIPVAKRLNAHDATSAVFAVDVSRLMLTRLMLNLGSDLGGIFVAPGNGVDIPNRDVIRELDAAYSMLMFQHVPPEVVEGYIHQVAACLVPGGVFRFQFVDGKTQTHGPYSHDLYSRDAIAWCRDAGLTVEWVDYELIHHSWTWITAVKS